MRVRAGVLPLSRSALPATRGCVQGVQGKKHLISHPLIHVCRVCRVHIPVSHIFYEKSC